MANVLVEGWRFLPHSYSLVNQFQCLEMLQRQSVTLYHRDAPLAHPDWRQTRGIFAAEAEQSLAAISPPPPGQQLDATFRIAFPYDMRPSSASRTAVFATVQSALRPNYFVGAVSVREAMQQSDALIVTPSNWSRDRLIESGVASSRIAVVPHGIDPAIFHPPSPPARESIRRKAGCEHDFVFLHIGAMTANKNIGLLLRAFAAVVARHPRARLALKGIDPLFGSANLLKEAAKELTEAQIALVQPRLGYWGGVWPMARMAELNQSADVYVSPYNAEGFNLPALEAAACGLPLICTAGGPTDEFTNDNFRLKIESTTEATPDAQPGRLLVPNFDSLFAHMCRVLEDQSFTQQARAAGPEYVASRFTWRLVVDQLLATLTGSGSG
ncbi:MAG TPA: glycosyltransferase family 4 protein [Humisphaera sp.]|jgi:glycosyltransferase involved in cell wall biosynthesis|nr:glycosyltransferase family 4 protein [Humisphaera sp.]